MLDEQGPDLRLEEPHLIRRWRGNGGRGGGKGRTENEQGGKAPHGWESVNEENGGQ
jgi:hypothetical protein